MTIGLMIVAAVALFLLACAAQRCWRTMPEELADRLTHLSGKYTLLTKVKICIGFYMIATKIDDVYEVRGEGR